MIVESPAKAKTINKYLGKDFIVLASLGHVSDLPAKSGSVIPDKDFEMIYEVNANSKKNLDAIYKAAKNSDAIYLATDPDREGEAIAWHVAELIKSHIKNVPNMKRVTFNAITKNAVKEAIANPRDLNMDLINAQQARRALDYLVGFTLSPLLWRKLPGCKSGGRVQSVALRSICEREEEIKSFVKQEYWDIAASFVSDDSDKPGLIAKLTHIKDKKLAKFDIATEEGAKEIVQHLSSSKFWIKDIQSKQQTRNPNPPFITSTLQQDASTKLGFNTKKTMLIAQKLYEGLKIDDKETGLITYMRTDGVYISEEAVLSIRNYVKEEFGEEYIPKEPRKYVSKVKNAQEAHEAIRPVDISFSPEYVRSFLTAEEYKLYDLIWKRTLASQMSSTIYDILNVFISGETDKPVTIEDTDISQLISNINSVINWELKTTGSTIKFDGFIRVYKDAEEHEEGDYIPKVDKNTSISLDKLTEKQHFTEPPARFTEASLVKQLEELGIGRPSTYASIISVLQDRKYVHMDKKRFAPDPRGSILNIFLNSFFAQYVQYDFTAKLEDDLDEICEGKQTFKAFLKKFWEGFIAKINEVEKFKMSEVIQVVKESMEKSLFTSDEDRACKMCQENGRIGETSLKFGKFGGFLACSNYPECKYTEQILSNADDKTSSEIGSNPNQELGIIDGKPLLLKTGRFGNYLELETDQGLKRTSVPSNKPITFEDAAKLMEFPKSLGAVELNGKSEEVLLQTGKFGLYIKVGTKNLRIPKSISPENITLQEVKDLLGA